MTRIFKARTNASTFLVVDEGEYIYLMDNEYTNSDACTVEDVEDWSSWDRLSKEEYEVGEDIKEWLGCYHDVPTEILEEKEV